MSIFSLFLARHHIQHFPRPWRKRPDKVRPPAVLQYGRYGFTRPNHGWQEMIFREIDRQNPGDFPGSI
jgi:hypothetical protein